MKYFEEKNKESKKIQVGLSLNSEASCSLKLLGLGHPNCPTFEIVNHGDTFDFWGDLVEHVEVCSIYIDMSLVDPLTLLLIDSDHRLAPVRHFYMV